MPKRFTLVTTLLALLLVGFSYPVCSAVDSNTKQSPAEGKAKVRGLYVGPIFADNAVLQQKKPIVVWGTDLPGAPVTVGILNQKATAITDKAGNWQVKLPPMNVGGPYELTIKDEKSVIVAHNIFVGEVWLCSGQSNMTLPTSFVKDSKEDIANSTNPNLHLFTMDETLQPEVTTDYKGKWQLADPASVRDYSGVAYYFGKRLQESLKIPVGIIWSSYQGTPIKVWMSAEAIDKSHENTQVVLPENFLAIRLAYNKDVEVWKQKVAECREKGLEEPAKPVLPSNFFAVSSAYNAMINPLIPYGIRGVAWYQGESDSDQPDKWYRMFGFMIDDWRKRWNDPNMPFVYVQLPAFGLYQDKIGDSLWAEAREAQTTARRLPYTYMVCTIDVAHPNAILKEASLNSLVIDANPAHGKFDYIDMHPREKKTVGERLGNAALNAVYHKPIPYCGPLYDSMEIEGNKVKIKFRYAEGGLKTGDGKPLIGFTITGADRKWVKADAKIDGDTVIVWSDKVLEPVAVRYGWASYPEVNLVNKDNLPASPFRTDKWVRHWTSKERAKAWTGT